jgi:hypothetical protein
MYEDEELLKQTAVAKKNKHNSNNSVKVRSAFDLT